MNEDYLIDLTVAAELFLLKHKNLCMKIANNLFFLLSHILYLSTKSIRYIQTYHSETKLIEVQRNPVNVRIYSEIDNKAVTVLAESNISFNDHGYTCTRDRVLG